MKSNHDLELQHPNSHKWPTEKLTAAITTEVSIMECRLQIALLNKRVERLSKIVQQTLSINQQDKLQQLMVEL